CFAQCLQATCHPDATSHPLGPPPGMESGTAVNGASAGSCAGGTVLGFCRFIGAQEALVSERDQNQDDGQADERADAVKATQAPKVMQEKFEEREHEQAHPGIARWRVRDFETDAEEGKCKD